MLIPKDIRFKFQSSYNVENYHHTLSRNNELRIQRETITRKTGLGGFGTGKATSFYFIDGVTKEFNDIDKMCDFYNEKFPYEEDNPDEEVVFIKVIRKRNKSL